MSLLNPVFHPPFGCFRLTSRENFQLRQVVECILRSWPPVAEPVARIECPALRITQASLLGDIEEFDETLRTCALH